MIVEDKINNYRISDNIREQALLLASIFSDYDRDAFYSDECLLFCVYIENITYEIYIYPEDEFDFIVENFNTEVLRIECIDKVHLMSLIKEHCGVELDD
jgi:hypothetical protein